MNIKAFTLSSPLLTMLVQMLIAESFVETDVSLQSSTQTVYFLAGFLDECCVCIDTAPLCLVCCLQLFISAELCLTVLIQDFRRRSE